MADRNNSEAGWSLREVVQLAPALAIAVASICFGTGLLIVNLRLAKYGIFTSGFVRAEYMLAGALYLFLIMVSRLMMAWAVTYTKGISEQWQLGKYGLSIRTIAFTLVLFFGVHISALGVLSNYYLTFLSWRLWATILILVISSGYIGNIKLFSSLFWNAIAKKSDGGEDEEWTRHVRDFMLTVPYILSAVATYAAIAYPSLSPAYGGGRKDQVILFPTKDGLEKCKEIGLPLMKDRRTIGPLEILTESESELVLLPEGLLNFSQKVHAIRLNRELVDAIVNIETKEE